MVKELKEDTYRVLAYIPFEYRKNFTVEVVDENVNGEKNTMLYLKNSADGTTEAYVCLDEIYKKYKDPLSAKAVAGKMLFEQTQCYKDVCEEYREWIITTENTSDERKSTCVFSGNYHDMVRMVKVLALEEIPDDEVESIEFSQEFLRIEATLQMYNYHVTITGMAKKSLRMLLLCLKENDLKTVDSYMQDDFYDGEKLKKLLVAVKNNN